MNQPTFATGGGGRDPPSPHDSSSSSSYSGDENSIEGDPRDNIPNDFENETRIPSNLNFEQIHQHVINELRAENLQNQIPNLNGQRGSTGQPPNRHRNSGGRGENRDYNPNPPRQPENNDDRRRDHRRDRNERRRDDRDERRGQGRRDVDPPPPPPPGRRGNPDYLYADDDDHLNITNILLGDDERQGNGKVQEINKIAGNILPWDISDPFETRNPWDYLGEIKDAVECVIPTRVERIRMFGQILAKNPSTRLLGQFIAKNVRSYDTLNHAIAYVTQQVYGERTQEAFREQFLNIVYENRATNGTVGIFVQHWYNFLRFTKFGAREGELHLVQRIYWKLSHQFRAYIGRSDPRDLPDLMKMVQDYEVGRENAEILAEKSANSKKTIDEKPNSTTSKKTTSDFSSNKKPFVFRKKSTVNEVQVENVDEVDEPEEEEEEVDSSTRANCCEDYG